MDIERVKQLIAAEIGDIIGLRRQLHANPEVAYQERNTSRIILEQLRGTNLALKTGLAGGTGIVGYLPGAHDKAIALRADIDGLPIPEKNGLSYASKNAGMMHACGHDGHSAILVGAARVLSKLGKLPQPVTFLFQPAEEGGAGAQRMIADGCLSSRLGGSDVAYAFALHGWPELALGTVGTRVGPLLANEDGFSVTIIGRGSHAAMPQVGRDPIVAASAVVGALQGIVARNIPPLEAVVLSVTQFHAGTARNAIADEARLFGTLRSLNTDAREIALARLRQVIEHVAEAHDCQAVIDVRSGYPVTKNDAGAVAHFQSQASAALSAESVFLDTPPSLGAEDFSYYCAEVPSCFFFLGLSADGRQQAQLHQPTFDFNDDALAIGIELFCRLALNRP